MPNKKRVLICNDDSAILDVCKLVLDQEYYVETFTSCENIIENVLKIKPHIILMDVHIYGDGEKAIKTLHRTEEIKHIPVILFTAVPGAAEINKRVHATAVIEKPFDINTLKKTIKENIL